MEGVLLATAAELGRKSTTITHTFSGEGAIESLAIPHCQLPCNFLRISNSFLYDPFPVLVRLDLALIESQHTHTLIKQHLIKLLLFCEK